MVPTIITASGNTHAVIIGRTAAVLSIGGNNSDLCVDDIELRSIFCNTADQ